MERTKTKMPATHHLRRHAVAQRSASLAPVFDIYPHLKFRLRKFASPAAARSWLRASLSRWRRRFEARQSGLEGLELVTVANCAAALENMLDPNNEKVVGFSLIEALWCEAHGKPWLGPPLSEALVQDVCHILLGALGRSHVYDATDELDASLGTGREAARHRSDQLDEMAQEVLRRIRSYPTGMDADVIRTREENRKRILAVLGGTDSDWHDWNWHVAHIIRDSDLLARLVQLTDDELRGLRAAQRLNVPWAVTPYYASLMDYEPHRTRDHAIRAQVLPPESYVTKMAEIRACGPTAGDFMDESSTSPIDLVTRRYPLIAIFKPFGACAQICVYCQRNWEIRGAMDPLALAPLERIEDALRWFQEHPTITEVLLTGGDPLMLDNATIHFLLERLTAMDHVERVRIGTRVPVVLPMRVEEELADMLASYHIPGRREVCVVTHFEHVYEVTPEAMAACQRLRRRGLSIYNQLVFTVENSRRFEAAALRRLLRLIGVDPYYTFNMKGKSETNHLRVPIARLQQEQKEEARLLPGLVRADEAVFNVPRLGKNYLRAWQHHDFLGIAPNGSRVYEFHPWEKKIRHAGTFVYHDVPILNYLRELQRRGENPEDYRSIWYYF